MKVESNIFPPLYFVVPWLSQGPHVFLFLLLHLIPLPTSCLSTTLCCSHSPQHCVKVDGVLTPFPLPLLPPLNLVVLLSQMLLDLFHLWGNGYAGIRFFNPIIRIRIGAEHLCPSATKRPFWLLVCQSVSPSVHLFKNWDWYLLVRSWAWQQQKLIRLGRGWKNVA